MAQGTIKSKKAAANPTGGMKGGAHRGGMASLGPRKGARVIKPKKRALLRGREMVKKHSAGLTAMTERTLGAKAGHLELLKGGKKNKDRKEGEGKGVGTSASAGTSTSTSTAAKGGSRKFG